MSLVDPPTSPDDRVYFHWQDYLLFALSLALPFAIGLFYFTQLFKGWNSCLRKSSNRTGDKDCNGDSGYKSTEQFLLGNRSINFVAVGLSTFASVLNGAFIIALPAEVHYQGAAMSLLTPLGVLLVIPLVTQVIVPKYHGVKLTSAYEYIERRFNKPARFVAAGVFIVNMMFFLAIVLYVPGSVFKQVTGVSFHLIVSISGGLCTLYTAMGGMKAVVYTDCLQMAIMLACLLALCALGSERSWIRIWELAFENGRINLNSFSIDPRARTTVWNLVIGGGVSTLCMLISNQMIVQRFMSVPSPGKAKKVIYVTAVCTLLAYGFITFVGLVIHSAYFKCDPIVKGHINTPDQMFVYFMMTTFGNHRGMPGLIVAAIIAAALSSISSAINSLSAVFLEDVIGPAFEYLRRGKLSDRSRERIATVAVVVSGLFTVGLSFLSEKLTSQLSQVIPTIWGAIGSPLGGMFLLGLFFPLCNAHGAIVGCLGGLALTLWLAIGSFNYAPPTPSLPIGACQGNLTLRLPLSPTNETQVHSPVVELYRISFFWYGFIGVGTTIIIGCLVSLVTGGCRTTDKEMKKHLWFSCADVTCPCCRPEVCPRRWGPTHNGNDDVDKDSGANNGAESSRRGEVDLGGGRVNYAYSGDADVVLKQFKRISPENGQ